MPRYPRKSIETEYLHIMTQGINKSYIFQKDEDIKYYIKILYELKEENGMNNIENLNKLIIVLRNKYNISFRKIANYLGINREKVRKLYKK